MTKGDVTKGIHSLLPSLHTNEYPVDALKFILIQLSGGL